MSIRLSCPSCNHAFALPALPEAGRAQCPRCGDAFPVRTFTEEEDGGQTAADRRPQSRPDPARRPGGRGFYALLGIIALIVVGASIAVGVRHRRGADTPTPAVETVTKPASQLIGLGYLRADSDVVFAVQGGPIVRYAERTQRPPGAVLAEAGLPEPVRAAVEQLGVPLDRIDHLAGGLTLGQGENVLRLALALVLTEPLADEGAFLRGLKARPVAGKAERHDVVLGRFPLLLVRASPVVWVFGLDERDLAAEKGPAGPGGVQLRGDERSGLRGLLAALPPDAAAWAAADGDADWTERPVVKLLGGSPEGKKLLPALKDGRGGALAVRLGAEPRLWLRVRAADDATAARVRGYFGARAGEVGSARAGGEGAVAEFESPFGPDTGKLLQRFVTDAGR